VKQFFSVKRLAIAGLVTLGLCALATALDDYLPSWLLQPFGSQAEHESAKTLSRNNCNTDLAEALDPTSKQNAKYTGLDNAGKLRIAGVSPQQIRLGSKLCLVLAGAASTASEELSAKNTAAKSAVVATLQGQLQAAANDDKKLEIQKKLASALSEAAAAENQPSPTVDISVFLNGLRSPSTLKVPATPKPQLVTYTFGVTAKADSDEAKFWRNLLSERTKAGLLQVTVGASKSQSSGPETVYDQPVGFRLYWPSIVYVGAISMILLTAASAIFAARSTILRDHQLTKLQVAEYNARIAEEAAAKDTADTKLASKATQAQEELTKWRTHLDKDELAGSFSLGRTQMALWLGLSIAGFIFLWLTLGFYQNVITNAILVLLGINGLTGLTALALDKDAPDKPTPKAISVNFLNDLSSDGQGVKLQRVQMIAWTCILGVIFAWNVVANFTFVDFDQNLLLLMGIVNSTYLGFKLQEAR
jgi:hypothetical protein